MSLKALPNPITRLIGNVLGARSRGVQDLRHGGPLATADSVSGKEGETAVPWLASATHTWLMGTVGNDPQGLVSRTLGDGLVRVRSPQAGAPASAQPELMVFPGLAHLQLAHDERVYQAIRERCVTRAEVLANE